MDTDGYIDKTHICEFTNTNKILSYQVYELITSLGLKATINEYDAKLYGRIVSKKYRITFKPFFPVFNLKRKLERHTNTIKCKYRYIISCDKIESVPVKCIQVDSTNKLFLCTKSFIPTHNSSIILQLMLLKSIFCGYKWVVFNPENSPADFFYQDIAEMFAGKPFDLKHPNCATEEERNYAKDFVDKHFFYIYPKDDSPTPDYVLKRFTEVIIKHKVDGVLIDPFNQLIHERSGRDDHYLELFLNKTKRFAQNWDIFFLICAHPNKPQYSGSSKKYDEPSIYDLAGGAMWANKSDNILCYHRPNFFIDPKDTWATFSSQKIKKQKLNGIPGKVNYSFDRIRSRFFELMGTPEEGYSRGYGALEGVIGKTIQTQSDVADNSTQHQTQTENNKPMTYDYSEQRAEDVYIEPNDDDIGF